MIRQAAADDRAAVQRLYEVLCPGEPVRVIASRIEEIAEHREHFLLVHETEGNVDGTVFVSLCPDAMFGTLPFAVIENLVVDPARTGQGIGGQLLEAAEELVREHRGTKIMLQCNRSRAESVHRFYQKRGYDGDLSHGYKKYIGRP